LRCSCPIYQAKITLKGIRPAIWRRVQVPATIRLSDLHQVIQTVFGWTDSHLHQFFIDRTSYGQPEDFDQDVRDEAKAILWNAIGSRTKRFTYVYDFGEDWRHEIVVEKIITGNSLSFRRVRYVFRRRASAWFRRSIRRSLGRSRRHL
jgi:Plasmid pRiA4b ORF-3-like protein